VFVRDAEGTRRDEYFYTTHDGFTTEQVVTLYTLRWNLDIFQPHYDSSAVVYQTAA